MSFKDRLGRDLQVGDEVIFTRTYNYAAHQLVGVVSKLCKTRVKVIHGFVGDEKVSESALDPSKLTSIKSLLTCKTLQAAHKELP